MSSIYSNVKNDRQFSASTGLKRQEFYDLLDVFKLYYVPKIQPIQGCSTPVLTDAGEALFFMLYYLKTGVTFQVLGICFNISDCSSGNYLKKIKPVLFTALKKLNMMPLGLFSNVEEFNEVFNGVTEIMIDVTEIPVPRAEDYQKQKKYYGKKKSATQ